MAGDQDDPDIHLLLATWRHGGSSFFAVPGSIGASDTFSADWLWRFMDRVRRTKVPRQRDCDGHFAGGSRLALSKVTYKDTGIRIIERTAHG
jgi:hypothetical protein